MLIHMSIPHKSVGLPIISETGWIPQPKKACHLVAHYFSCIFREMFKAQESLSGLSCDTASDFELPAAARLRMELSIDDVLLTGMLSDPNEIQFTQEHFIFHLKQQFIENKTRVVLDVKCLYAAQWHLLYQMRIKTAKFESEATVVDREVVEFCTGYRPIQVDVTSPEVATIRFEFRTINQQFTLLPQFADGDISVLFGDGSSIKTYKALLSMVSNHMGNLIKSVDNVDCLDVGEFPKNDFLELLYQLYPTRRPLYAAFRSIANASNAFKVDAITYKICEHFVEYNRVPRSIQEKLQAAIGLELDLAVQEIVYRAVQDGSWGTMIRMGFNPSEFFNETIYKTLICPAVIKAREIHFGGSMLQDPFQQPKYTSESSGQDPNNESVLFYGTPMFVNRGILQVHGMEGFTRNENGQLLAKYSREMHVECAERGLIPGQVLISLLDFIYPGGPAPFSEQLRPAIVFCFDHDWTAAKEQLEELLLLEPATSIAQYLGQIIFAERFQLVNMLRNCIFRSENSCIQFATELQKSADFARISSETRDKIVDRLCSGWSLEPKYIGRLGMRKATSHRERNVDLQDGGAAGFNAAAADGTLCELNSDYYFGSAKELEIV